MGGEGEEESLRRRLGAWVSWMARTGLTYFGRGAFVAVELYGDGYFAASHRISQVRARSAPRMGSAGPVVCFELMACKMCAAAIGTLPCVWWWATNEVVQLPAAFIGATALLHFIL